MQAGDLVEMREDFKTWANTTLEKGLQGTVKSVDLNDNTLTLQEFRFYDIPIEYVRIADVRPERKGRKK